MVLVTMCPELTGKREIADNVFSDRDLPLDSLMWVERKPVESCVQMTDLSLTIYKHDSTNHIQPSALYMDASQTWRSYQM